MPALLPAAAMSAAGRRTSSLSGGDRGAGSQHRQLMAWANWGGVFCLPFRFSTPPPGCARHKLQALKLAGWAKWVTAPRYEPVIRVNRPAQLPRPGANPRIARHLTQGCAFSNYVGGTACCDRSGASGDGATGPGACP